ncbi:hypothetical protein Salat_1345900 [Sesamum alatum]|uniref:Uncharacterized protein n=1 Tax=Sesamum alatum TaxID=300844 RepID=A0AAE1YI41_9LAMI|nr:hypothetical protein Salat_1345900 [Sesamum alatum]
MDLLFLSKPSTFLKTLVDFPASKRRIGDEQEEGLEEEREERYEEDDEGECVAAGFEREDLAVGLFVSCESFSPTQMEQTPGDCRCLGCFLQAAAALPFLDLPVCLWC